VKVCINCAARADDSQDRCPNCGGPLKVTTISDAINSLYDESERKK